MTVACAKEPDEVSSIRLSQNSATLSPGEVLYLRVDVYPENARENDVVWKTSNSDIVTVNNGKVTAVAVGKASVLVQVGNRYAVCHVTVEDSEDSIKINFTSVTLVEGEKIQLTVTSQNSIIWKSSNQKVATVDDRGWVKAIAPGTATITAFVGETSVKKTVKCEVTVIENEKIVTSIEVNPGSLTLSIGEEYELDVKVYPEDASDKNLQWSSSNSNVVTVNDGLVTAVAGGRATITVQAESGVQDWCYVRVREVEVTSVKLYPTSVTLSQGDTIALKAEVFPANATNKTLSWTSSSPDVAKVDNGEVMAIAAGTAIITATSTNGFKSTCTVVVMNTKNPLPGESEGTVDIEW